MIPLILCLNYSMFYITVLKSASASIDSTRWNVEAISISCPSIMDNSSS